MSVKKKNPLKDLSAFLAHQEEASKITTPKDVADHGEFMEQKPTQVAVVNRPEKVKIGEEVSPELIIDMLDQLMKKNSVNFREAFGEIILNTIEKIPNPQPADTMLINTVLYLNNQDNWDDAVKSYWDNRN
jgi:hypothetical protein